VEIYRYGPHRGEEPPLSGTRGSGTVFFSRCTMRCLYCQNHPWSQEGAGRPVGVAGLARMLRELHGLGCHNWNLVSPTPWLPWIVEALDAVRGAGVTLPVVYNTSGFERPETLRALAGRVQVYLTDLRYADEASAAEGSEAPGYVGAARAALLAMREQTGPLTLGADGLACRGTICRLLVLPGRAGEAVASLEWLAAHAPAGVAISVMAQYTPAYRAAGRAPWNREPTQAEYARVVDAVDALGFTEGWVQEYGQAAPAGLVGFDMQPA
jgi:putative pyruvate formate lyase activating enzyme